MTDIEHVVIFIQENRSFDHYFGSCRGVRGFSDQGPAFQQPDPAITTKPPAGVLLPFHLDTSKTNAACTHDITHDWVPQHQSWDNGAMDGSVTSRLPINTNDAVLTMGYYTCADPPFYYPVADAFTICDNYFCSSTPWRLPFDPAGQNGGPLLQTPVANRSSFFGKLTYTTIPEQLQAREISWKVYSSPDQNMLNIFSNNVLSYFKNFQDPASPLYRKAFGPSFRLIFWPMRCQETCHKSPGCWPRSLTPTTRLRPHSWREHAVRDYQRFDWESSAMGKDGTIRHL